LRKICPPQNVAGSPGPGNKFSSTRLSRGYMSISIRKTLSYTVSGVITILFLWLAFRGTDLRDVYGSIQGVNLWWMVVAAMLLVISMFFRAYRWRFFLAPLKKDLRRRNLLSGVTLGYLLNNFLPRAGEIVRAYSVARLESIPMSAVFGSIVVERVLDLVIMIVMLLMLPLVYHGPLMDVLPWLQQTQVTAGAVVVFFCAGIFIALWRRGFAERVLSRIARLLPNGIGQRVEGTGRSFLDGFLFLREPGSFVPIVVWTVVLWASYVFMVYAGLVAFGLHERLGLSGAWVVLAISTIGVAIPTPGATGTYHFFVSAALTGLYGIDAPTALSYATVSHATTFLGTTLIGVGFLFVDQIRITTLFGAVERRGLEGATRSE